MLTHLCPAAAQAEVSRGALRQCWDSEEAGVAPARAAVNREGSAPPEAGRAPGRSLPLKSHQRMYTKERLAGDGIDGPTAGCHDVKNCDKSQL